MKYPPYLKYGDKIAIVSPAGKIEKSIVEHAAQMLSDQGFVVEIGKHTFDREGLFAGDDIHRASDMQRALDDKKVKAIICSRG